MTDLATSGGKGDDLQKHFIDRIRTLEDAYSPAASRYFEWIEDTGRGFIDGLESYLKHLRETYQSARTISTYISAAKNRVRMLLPFLPATERGQLREYLRRLKPDKSERSIDDDKVLSGEEIEKLLAGLRSGKAKVPGAETIAVAAEFLHWGTGFMRGCQGSHCTTSSSSVKAKRTKCSISEITTKATR